MECRIQNEYNIPIFGGKKSRSGLVAAKYRKKQAEIEIKNNEIAMTNQIDTSIQHVYHAVKQAKNYQKIEDAQKKLLDIEIMRLDIGKGTSKDVLEKEKELNEAKETKLKSLIYYQKALLALQVADGSLLKNFDINIAVNTE